MAGLWCGVWLGRDLAPGFIRGAKWSGYSGVGKSDLLFGHDFFDAPISGHS